MLQFDFYSESFLPEVNNAVADYVSFLITGETGKFEKFCTMAIGDESELIGGVVYNNYQPDYGTLEVSGAAKHSRCMNRDILRASISMPFDVLKCQAITARYSEGNKPVRRLWKAFGAKEYVIPRLRGKNEPPEVLAVLTDDAWRQSVFSKVKATV